MIDTLAITYCEVAGVSYEDGLKLAAFERELKAEFEEYYKKHPLKPAKRFSGEKKQRGTEATFTCTDHLGNVYKCKGDMCRAYGIRLEVFRNRLEKGWSIKDALTTPTTPFNSQAVKDHLGKEYKSTREMLRRYGISQGCFFRRQQKGWSLKDCLTTPFRGSPAKATEVVKDHLGVEYSSVTAMCKAYKISSYIFKQRTAKGQSLEEALTTPVPTFYHECTDHLGKHYKSITDMCKAWDVAPATYSRRMKTGWTQRLALTMPEKARLSLHIVKKTS